MDPIRQATQKIQAERARQSGQQQQQQPPPPESAPPPYVSDSGYDSDDEMDDEEKCTPLTLTINAANSVQGNCNLVPTSPTPLQDAARQSTWILQVLNNLNNGVCSNNGNLVPGSMPKRPLKVNLTINCGITVVGDRNVIGNVGVKPKGADEASANVGLVAANSEAVVGAKRKAEDVGSNF